METQIIGKPIFDESAHCLLDGLEKLGFNVVWEKEWRGYDIIECDIAKSDALLAIIDSTWMCSTWMMSEVTYANGDIGIGSTNNPKMKPIPVFLYPVIDISKHWLNKYKGSIMLDRDVENAKEKIRVTLTA